MKKGGHRHKLKAASIQLSVVANYRANDIPHRKRYLYTTTFIFALKGTVNIFFV